MNNTGSLCPASKSAGIIGDKWILLILRELYFGATRFNEFQRALPRVSPTILSKRLKKMEADGLIIRKTSSRDKTKEYRLTRCGRELAPIIEHMATWGLRWARRQICEEDFDVGAFMWDFHRTLDVTELPDGETVLRVKLRDQDKLDGWWLVVHENIVDLCTDDPGKDVDLYITADFPALVGVWMGDVEVQAAIAAEDVIISGEGHLMRSVSSWFPKSPMAEIRPVTAVN